MGNAEQLARAIAPLITAVANLGPTSVNSKLVIEHEDGTENVLFGLEGEPIRLSHLLNIADAFDGWLNPFIGTTTVTMADEPAPPTPGGAGAKGQASVAITHAMTLDGIMRANVARAARWHDTPDKQWGPAQWLIATLGELGELAGELIQDADRDDPLTYWLRALTGLGEAANGLKKLWRIRAGMLNISGAASRQINDRSEALRLIERELRETLYSVHALFYQYDLGVPEPEPSYQYAGDGSRARAQKEWADVLIYHLLTADALGLVFPSEIVADVFNETSERYGFPDRLPEGAR